MKPKQDETVNVKFSKPAWRALRAIRDGIDSAHRTNLNFSDSSEAEKNKYREMIDRLSGGDAYSRTGVKMLAGEAQEYLPILAVGRSQEVNGSRIMKQAVEKAKIVSREFIRDNHKLGEELAKIMEHFELNEQFKMFVVAQTPIRKSHQFGNGHKFTENLYDKLETVVPTTSMDKLIAKTDETLVAYKKKTDYYAKANAHKSDPDNHADPANDPTVKYLRAIKLKLQAAKEQGHGVSLLQFERATKQLREEIAGDKKSETTLFFQTVPVYKELKLLAGSNVQSRW